MGVRQGLLFMICPSNGAIGWQLPFAPSMLVNSGGTFRSIAEALFGKRIPDRDWKTHDLRNRIIRLVQSGLALMRGGYRELLRPKRKDK